MKKLVARIFCGIMSALLCLTLLCSCSDSRQSYAFYISGIGISEEILAYYTDFVRRFPEDCNLPDDASDSQIKAAAEHEAAVYVAQNSFFEKGGYTLSGYEKAQLSQEITEKWSFYGAYYKKLGISKQTLAKILTSSTKREAMFDALYDTGGIYEVPEKEIKAYYQQNYTVFRSINGYLTTTGENGKKVSLTEKELIALKSDFSDMVSNIKNGSSLDDECRSFAKKQGGSYSAAYKVLRKGSDEYPDGFFEAVQSAKVNSPKIIQKDDYIFLVMKADSKTATEYYPSYRENCLKAMKSDEFAAYFDKQAQSYKISDEKE